MAANTGRRSRTSTNSLSSKLSRYSIGGVTEQSGNMLGYWEAYDISGLHSDDDVMIDVTHRYVGRPDLIASDYYGSPYYAWLVLLYNRVTDLNEELVVGASLRIPSAERVENVARNLKPATVANQTIT